jgi:exopolyphosphatase / guanosine-5'-triphosphate,3'-diphosphate pyrophosphatase
MKSNNLGSALRRVAIIDCGTNTFNLRIVDFLEDVDIGCCPWKRIFSMRLPVMIGQGGIGQGIIRPDRITRGIDAIGIMREAIHNYSTDEVYIIATSAIRDASNSKDFTNEVFDRYGYKVKIISGSTEAGLIQAGVALTYTPEDGTNVLTLDIGGGSTECVLWNSKEIIWTRSFDVGVARLKDFFKMSDHFGKDAYEKMTPYLDDMFEPLLTALMNVKPSVLVGSSGSFDTFYHLTKEDSTSSKNKKISKERFFHKADKIDIGRFHNASDMIVSNSLSDRLKMVGMPPDRADLIPYAAAIILWVERHTDFKEFYRSKYAIREGVLNQIAKEKPAIPSYM